MTHSVTITCHVPIAIHRRFQAAADAEGLSLHRYMQKTLHNLAPTLKTERVQQWPDPRLTRSSDSNNEKLTECTAIEMPVELAQRLHTTAKQMTMPSGLPAFPAWLARELVLHPCYKPSDIAERFKREVDPNYVDHVGFQGKTKVRGGKLWHTLLLRTTFDQRQAIFAVARDRHMAVAELVRRILNGVLPKYDTGPNAPQS